MRLKNYMEKHRLKQDDFAARIGVNQCTLSRYICEMRVPTAMVMRKIFAATNGAVTPNDFFLSDEQIAAAGHDDPARDPKGGAAC